MLSGTVSAVVAGAEPWRSEGDEVAAALATDLGRGLTAGEAAARLVRFGLNVLEEARPVPVWRKFLGQLADPLIYLLFAAVVVSLVAWVLEGDEAAPYDAIVITAIIVANAVLGYVQEARAEQAVAALQRMAAATAGVVRDGREERIPAAEVVPGDILALAAGDAVAADGRLIEAASLTIAEASLTGESEAVLKDVDSIVGPAGLGDRVNMVFSGTAVVRGRGRAVVTATAMATEMGNVARLLGQTETQATPLQREVDRIGRMLGIAVVMIAAVVVGAILLTSDIRTASDLVSVLLVGVSLAVAAVPEGLPAVLSVVLALGVQRMAQQRAIVKKLSSVETLGSASVICSDKTGTLTKNEMTIEKVVTGSGEVDVTGSGYRPDGEVRVDGRPLDDPRPARRGPCGARGGQPGERRGAARGSRRVDDPGRSHRGGVPGGRGEDRRADRVTPRAVRARRRGAVHLRAQADEHAARRPRRPVRRRRRHQGRTRRAARPLHRGAPRPAVCGRFPTRAGARS